MNRNWKTKHIPDGPGWAIITPDGDQYATAHTQTTAINFATQMAGVTALLDRINTARVFARHRRAIQQLHDAMDMVNAKVPSL